MNKKRLDFSLGNPLRPLTAVANYAFARAQEDLNHYHMTNLCAPPMPIGQILTPIRDYFTARGFYSDNWNSVPLDNMLMTGGGVTEGFDLIMRAMAEDVRKQEKHRRCTIKPVIIMPVPTYGLFADTARAWGIEPVLVPRDRTQGGRLDREVLRQAFIRTYRQNKRIVAYYDSNPHNPLGLVRGREETESIAELIAAMNYQYSKRPHGFIGGRRNDLWQWEGIAGRVRVIDDRVYDGLQYQGQPEPYGFAQLERDNPLKYQGFYKDTLTLCGPSKAGLVGVRAGLVIADHQHIDALRRQQFMASFAPSTLAMHALSAYFSDQEPFATWRREHLAQTNAVYEFNGRFMKALVNGLGAVPEIGAAEAEKMVRALAEARSISAAEAHSRLRAGIAGVRIITTPQAGFFHLLDFEGLRGRSFRWREDRSDPVKTQFELNLLTHQENVAFLFGDWLGLRERDLILRATFAKGVGEIADFADRVQAMAARVSPPRPRKSKAQAAPQPVAA